MERHLPTQDEWSELLYAALNGQERKTEDELYAALISLHPTLQQAFWRVMKQIINRYGDIPPAFSDARNEASVEFCKRLADSPAKFVSLPTI